MRSTTRCLPIAAAAASLAVLFGPVVWAERAAPRVDFDRDVRPIVSDKCFTCHGPDSNKRQAGLRFDTPDGVFGKLPNGDRAVVPGKPDSSALVMRITAPPEMRMPPAGSGKTLTATQIATLKAWVSQGARYEPHWAFVAPRRPAVPGPEADPRLRKDWAWALNPIDRFVLARLHREGLRPSPPADRATLLRRVTLDLTGLPPAQAELDSFLADRQPGAYERVVDRLLATPHYGERMALMWLDLARYADTHGYHIDSQRDMWPWRNWVIGAFNTNLPYDQFVVQQLAGDLLPNATLDQRIATGFNRNHPINFEGGAIPEEYQAAYIFDRIDTTSTAFMGLTVRCAQCHDHKYDPISQRDYYRLYAFFNNVPEQGLDGQKGNAAPFIKAPGLDQTKLLAEYDAKLGQGDQALADRMAQARAGVDVWLKGPEAANLASSGATTEGALALYSFDEGTGSRVADTLRRQPAGIVKGSPAWGDGKLGKALSLDGMSYVELGNGIRFERTDKFSYGAWVNPSAPGAMTVVSRMDDAVDFRGWDMYLDSGRVFVHLISKWESNAIRVNTKTPFDLNRWTHVFMTYDGSGKAKGVHVYVDGKPAEVDVTHDSLTGSIVADKPVLIGRRNPGAPFKGLIDEVRIYGRELRPEEVAAIGDVDAVRTILAVPEAKRTPEQKDALVRRFLETTDQSYRTLAADVAETRKKRQALDDTIPTTMVMEEMPKPRETHILKRGQYDQLGEKVDPGTPSMLPPLPAGMKPDRLALARWLVDPRHPLTARVAVNRFWQMLFGMGLVKTAENFGTQGDPPSNPRLLDWLATEFQRGGWDVKKLLRLIVTSATYRQSSRVSPELEKRDPENRWLARGPRFRLPAEAVRDQALAVSGLLVDKIGGPSVKPYQPAGLWEELSFKGGFTAQYYEQDHGDALYRRSMYTFWKRTVPPPSLQTFDAPEREYCVVRRSVTNTPLQALVLMNDPIYVESSRKLAERAIHECPSGGSDRLDWVFRQVLCRRPSARETAILSRVLARQQALFTRNPKAAVQLLSVGESKRDEKLSAPDLAAWATVASVVLQLDETVTKG